MLRRPDTTTVQEPVKADIEALQEPGQPFDEVKDKLNGSGPILGSRMSITANGQILQNAKSAPKIMFTRNVRIFARRC